MKKRFEARIVVVTGAGGDIGKAAAVRFAREGATVALLDRRLDLMAETLRICKDTGAAALALEVDQTDRNAVEAGITEIAERLGVPSVLFANAGYGKFATFLNQEMREWDRHIAVNLTGTFSVAQCVARAMVAARMAGAIVINASSGAVQYSDLLSAYCASKSALRMLAIGMASELGGHRIRVNVVMPGVIETGMTAPMLAGPDGSAHRDWLLSETPVGRLGQAEDVANLVLFLAGDDAAFITGQSVLVDGGQTIHGHPRWYRTDYRNDFVDEWKVVR